VRPPSCDRTVPPPFPCLNRAKPLGPASCALRPFPCLNRAKPLAHEIRQIAVSKQNTIKEWHERLGHLNDPDLKELIEQGNLKEVG